MVAIVDEDEDLHRLIWRKKHLTYLMHHECLGDAERQPYIKAIRDIEKKIREKADGNG